MRKSAIRGEPHVGAGNAVGQLQPAAGHDAGVGQREVVFALDGGADGQSPAEAEPRHVGELRGLVEVGVVAADGQDELALRRTT